MTEATKITQEMIDLYDDYTHVTLDRRGFIARLAALAGGTAAAYAVMARIEADDARAAIVAEDDPRLETRTIAFPGAGGEIAGYMAAPAVAAGKLPAVVVVHENRGLDPHIKDVARRVAAEGFVALAPDFLSPAGGTPEDRERAREMIYALDPEATVRNGVAAVAFLANHAKTTGKVGAVGFCWGGGLVNQIAANSEDLDAAVAFYGRVPASTDVPRIEARLLLHYAGLDDRINQGIPEFRAALEAAEVEHTIHMYEGVNHAFHNDTAAARYDKAAAELAWWRTIAFFKETLG